MIYTGFRKAVPLALILISAATVLWAQPLRPLGNDKPLASIPENDDIRLNWMDGLLRAPRDRVLSFRSRTETNLSGRWRLEVIKGPKAFFIAIVPDLDVLYGQGAWIIKRSLSDGSFVQAKVFLRNDPNTFLRLYPFGERSKLDLVIYRGVVRHEVILPVSFEKILGTPLKEILVWTKDSVDWDLLSPIPGLYDNIRFLTTAIRERLPSLQYADDGAMDERGRYARIADGASPSEPGLNCSGFVKWVIDGLLKPITGSWLAIEPLKERHEDLRGSSFTQPYEKVRDPFFGLDWSWNLGKAMADALYPHRKNSVLDNEVQISPFALLDRGGTDPANGGQSYSDYPTNFEIDGYRVDGLRPLLYILAMREPGNFYIASFNRRMGKDVVLRQYFHEALLFPYFEAEGEFRVAVFESSAETSLDAVIRRYPSEFAHLVRIPALPEFAPPMPTEESSIP